MVDVSSIVYFTGTISIIKNHLLVVKWAILTIIGFKMNLGDNKEVIQSAALFRITPTEIHQLT